jgi:hypothetical protein
MLCPHMEKGINMQKNVGLILMGIYESTHFNHKNRSAKSSNRFLNAITLEVKFQHVDLGGT